MTASNVTQIEAACLSAFRSGVGLSALPDSGRSIDQWVRCGFFALLVAARAARSARFCAASRDHELKPDGSPATAADREVEDQVRDLLAEFAPDVNIVGEERGGSLPESGIGVAIDPIDGTWAFLGGTETYASTLAFFRDGEPFLGMVASPVAGEIAYAVEGAGARLVRLSLFGEPDVGIDLPEEAPDSSRVLVNLHPSKSAGSAAAALHHAWAAGQVQMVRSPGGSPAWALLDVARGRFVYVNLWSQRPAEPFDLASGVMLVRAAGGEVTDLSNRPIDMLHHRGPFVAAVDARSHEQVVRLVRGAVRLD